MALTTLAQTITAVNTLTTQVTALTAKITALEGLAAALLTAVTAPPSAGESKINSMTSTEVQRIQSLLAAQVAIFGKA